MTHRSGRSGMSNFSNFDPEVEHIVSQFAAGFDPPVSDRVKKLMFQDIEEEEDGSADKAQVQSERSGDFDDDPVTLGGQALKGNVAVTYIWHPPRKRKEVPEDEQGMFEEWPEFVGDIVFVAAMYKLGNVVTYCGPWEGIFSAWVIFLLLWKNNQLLQQYINIVEGHDTFRLFLIALNLCGLFVMSLAISDGSDKGKYDCKIHFVYLEYFYWGFMLARGSILILWLIFLKYLSGQERFFLWRHVATLIIAMVEMTALILVVDTEAFVKSTSEIYEAVDPSSPMWNATDPKLGPAQFGTNFTDKVKNPNLVMFCLCIVVMQELLPGVYNNARHAFNCAPKSRRVWFLVHINHLILRRTLCFMICLGESMISLLKEPYDNPDVFWGCFYFQMVAFFVVMTMAFLHNNTIPHHFEEHVFRLSNKWATRQTLTYYLAYFEVLMVGIGLKVVLYILRGQVEDDLASGKDGRFLKDEYKGGIHKDWNETLAVFTLASSVAMVHLCIIFIEYCQKQGEVCDTRRNSIIFTVKVCLAMAQMGYFLVARAAGWEEDIIIDDMTWHAMLTLPALFLDLHPKHYFVRDDHGRLSVLSEVSVDEETEMHHKDIGAMKSLHN